jgi:uncharacterized protein
LFVLAVAGFYGCFKKDLSTVLNPLEQFVPVEERSDGLYAKVGRIEKEALRMDIIESAVENAFVMNFDLTKFRDVVVRGRGAFEKIGPLFEFYNPEIEKYLQVTVTAQKAVLKINSGCLSMGRRPSEKTLLFYLRRKGITSGLKLEQIRVMIADNKWDEYYDIAEIIPPTNGQDARIEMGVSIDPNLQPQLRTDGSVDYRDVKSFTSAVKGQVLAIKFPPTLGKPGIGLNGEPIPPTLGNDHPLPNGKNTEISADGKQLIASKTGIVFQEGALISIVEMLHIGGNVDFNVGNVKYSGDVLINGNVLPGFSVEADGTVHINGDVESASVISRNGRVVVEKGILGKGDTYISAKMGIFVCFAQEASLITEGLISFDKFLMHCDCICESIDGHGATSSIIGGEIRAEKNINVKQIGTDKGPLTKVILFDKQKAAVEEKIKELINLDKKLKIELEPIEKQLRTKAALLKRADEVTLRQREEVKKWLDAHNLFNQKIKYVAQKIEVLKNELKGPRKNDGYIHVHGNVFAGTELEIYDIKYIVTEKLINKRFRIQDNGIQSEE